jgi:hypothetical protein
MRFWNNEARQRCVLLRGYGAINTPTPMITIPMRIIATSIVSHQGTGFFSGCSVMARSLREEDCIGRAGCGREQIHILWG